MLPYDLRRQLWGLGLVQAHFLVQAQPFLRVQFLHFGSSHFAFVSPCPSRILKPFCLGRGKLPNGVFVLLLVPNEVVPLTLSSVSDVCMSEANASFDTSSTLVDSNETPSFFISSHKRHTIWERCRCFFPWTNCTRVYRAIQFLGNALPTFLLWYSISTAYYHPWSTMWHWVYVDTSVQKYISRGFWNIQCNRMQILQQLYIVRHPSTSTICIIYIYTINIYIYRYIYI